MSEEKRYIVVGRSRPSARFPNGHNLEISLDNGGKVSIASKYADMGFEAPVPTDLIIEAQCSAVSIHQAVENMGDIIQALINAVELSVDAWLGDFEVELVYELFPGAGKREFFQSFIPEMPLSMVPSRAVNLPAALELTTRVHTHSERRRLAQSIALYHEALRNWRPGNELLCAENIFLGIECIKTVALREYQRKTEKTAEQLGKEWEYRAGGPMNLTPFLAAEARTRLIFMGDLECFKKTVNVSDGFEHGYENLAVLKKEAAQVVVTSARYLREAILKLSGISGETYNSLINPTNPPRGPLKLLKYTWGQLDSQTENLAAEGSLYPYCKWKTELGRVFINETGGYSFAPKESFTAVIGPGVTLTPSRTEAWDGSIIMEQPNPVLDPAV